MNMPGPGGLGGRRRTSGGVGRGTGRQAAPAPDETVPLAPSPEEREIMGLGAIIAILRLMTDQERMTLLDYVWARYGYRRDREVETGPRSYTEGDTNELTRAIQEVRSAFDSELLARALLDAGWRRVRTR